MEDLELVCFQIIASVGTARSLYIEAIQWAKKGNYDQAEECVRQGDEAFLQGHQVHAKLIQREAADANVSMTLLLTHAEDQLMSAEGFQILCKEFIDVYREMRNPVQSES